jgi:hypothetical protein
MPAPSLTPTHLKTSKQIERGNLVNRYWFEWSNRKQLSGTVVRLELLDDAGQVLTTASFQLPKVKITGYVPASETSPQKPIYDSTVWIKLDDIVRDQMPASFRYYTVGVTSKSEAVTSPMQGVYEDLSMFA